MKNPIQWHPGFNAVMQIEFEEECDKLRFEAEHNLGKKPLQIDLLVVKLDGGASIRKNIGRIFRKYNIIEYKSPKDYLSVNDFYKVVGYTCFYQADTKHVLEIQPDELTITFVSSQYPRIMMKHLKDFCQLDIKCIEQGREQGIKSAIAICIQLGASRDIAFKNLCEKFSLTESQTEEYLQKYWTEKSA